MMNNAPAVFASVGDGLFEATARAGGPWGDRFCHGGAPAALLASVIDKRQRDAPMTMARFTVDLLRAVPVGVPLRVLLHDTHAGRQVCVTEAELVAGEVVVARASALRLLARTVDLGPQVLDAPSASDHRPMPGGFSEQFKIVPVSGGFGVEGPAEVWFRMDSLLRDDASVTPLESCVAAADFGSGIAHELPFDRWQFPSLDLTVAFARPPVGEWVRLRSSWLTRGEGGTPCRTELSDLYGTFGLGLQTVLIQPRRES